MSAHEDKETSFTIKVNGRTRTVDQKKLDYEDVVKLAYPDADFVSGNYNYSVIYFKKEGGDEKDLIAGEHVNIQDGYEFNVRRTDKS